MFDATGTKNLFPSLSSPREFSDWPAFFEFMVGNLHATLIIEDGVIAGVRANVSMVGDAFGSTLLVKSSGLDVILLENG